MQSRTEQNGCGTVAIKSTKKSRVIWATLISLVFAASGVVLGTIYSGLYDVTAVKQHTAPVYWALDTGSRYAIRRSAQRVTAPRWLA